MPYREGYFESERRRARGRLAASTVSAAAAFTVLALAVLLLRWERIGRWLPEEMRVGFEGPAKYVERIILEQSQGGPSARGPLGPVTLNIAFEQGGSGAVRTGGEGTPSSGHSRTPGTGESDTSLVVRSVRRRADVPLVASEDLVIVRLGRPIYPQAAIDANIEGRVQIQALVDTTGRVVDVQVMASTGHAVLERAATVAVWQSSFRPYRSGGRLREVYALFSFSFKLD
jgi:TonB family protein